jgi:6-phosphogluconolactonase
VKLLAIAVISAAALALSGCPITGGARYTVGGTLTGLTGSGLVLELNGSANLTFNSNGGFSFGTRLDNSAAYAVTVVTQPSNPSQNCTVRNGSGTIDKASITNVIVACTQTGRFAYVADVQSNTISGFAIEPSGALVPLSGSPFAANGAGPAALAVDPDGQFLFVANNASNSVSMYSINATTGALAPTGFAIAAGVGPVAVTVDPTDHFVYVANLTSNTISAYMISGSTLIPVVDAPFSAGAGPAALAIDPNGNFLYVTNFNGNTISVFLIDQANGMLSAVSGSPFGTGAGPVSIAIDPTDAFAYVSNNSAGSIAEYALNATTGALTPVAGSPIAAGTNPLGLTIDPTGRYVFGANAQAANQVATFAITPATGALSVSSTTAAGTLPIVVAIDPSGQFLYAANSNSNDVSAYTVSASGALIPVAGSPFAVGVQPHGIAID